jgi:predicted acyltransferase
MFSTHHLAGWPAVALKRAAARPRAERLPAIDHFRGFAILMMAVMNHLLGVETLPAWLQHTPDVGLTVTDLGAPWFIFAIGLTYRRSYERRAAAQGRARASIHFAQRAAVLFALGFVMACAEQRLRGNSTGMCWSVLQAIGVAILLTLPVIALPATGRLLAGLLLLAAHQLMLDRYWLPAALGSTHGGPPGALGWTAMLMLTTVFADLAATPDRRKLYALATAAACAGGVALSFWAPISKARVSASYVFVSLAASAALYALFYVLTERVGWRSAGLTAWGKNPLVLYLALNVLLALLVLPDIPAWHVRAPFWLAAAQALLLVATLSRAARWLDRRGVVISL